MSSCLFFNNLFPRNKFIYRIKVTLFQLHTNGMIIFKMFVNVSFILSTCCKFTNRAFSFNHKRSFSIRMIVSFMIPKAIFIFIFTIHILHLKICTEGSLLLPYILKIWGFKILWLIILKVLYHSYKFLLIVMNELYELYLHDAVNYFSLNTAYCTKQR